MGNNENFDGSNKEKKEYYEKEIERRKKQLTDKDLEFMESSPWFDSDEMAVAYNYRTEPYKDYKHYENVDKAFDNEKEKFKSIDLDEFKKNDGTYDIIRLKRPLKGKDSFLGNIANKAIEKLHHEGVAIGNGKNYLIFDYGKKGGDLDFSFKISDNLNEWTIKQNEGICSKNDNEIKEIFFDSDAEKWSSSRSYKINNHNCQHFAQNKIDKLKN